MPCAKVECHTYINKLQHLKELIPWQFPRASPCREDLHTCISAKYVNASSSCFLVRVIDSSSLSCSSDFSGSPSLSCASASRHRNSRTLGTSLTCLAKDSCTEGTAGLVEADRKLHPEAHFHTRIFSDIRTTLQPRL